MIRFAENLNKMITAGLGGALDPPRTEVAVGHCIRYLEASGPVASFESNIAAPIRNLRVDMHPIQAGSGDPSPDNIRPITGRDSVTVTRTGKNLFDKTKAIDGYIDDSDGTVKGAAPYKCTDYVDIVGGSSYYVITEQISALWGAWYDKNKVYIGGQTNYANTAITAPANAAYLRLTIKSSVTGNLDTFGINYPSTDHDYHAYDGQSATIQLGQTVYGGTLDVTNGKLVNEWANIASYDGEALPGEWISDRDAYAPGTTPTTGAQVCYKLATPLTIQLTPAQLSTLVGENNVWCDAGNISLEYPYYEETEGY